MRLLGFVEDSMLAPLYAGASAVIMVGLAEGFGLPALEALAMGVPVVASHTGALPEVVGDVGLLCDPYAPSSIRSALERALTDDVHRARVACEGPALARTRGWSRTARGLHDACVRALSRSATNRRAA